MSCLRSLPASAEQRFCCRDPLYRDITGNEPERIPVEIKLIDCCPDTFVVMQAKSRGIKPVGKPARKPLDRDEPSGQPRRKPSDQRLARRRVGSDQHSE